MNDSRSIQESAVIHRAVDENVVRECHRHEPEGRAVEVA